MGMVASAGNFATRCCNLHLIWKRATDPNFYSTRPKPAFGRQGLDSDHVTVTHRGVLLTSFGAKNVTFTHRGVQLTSFGAKNVTVTHRGVWCKKRYRYSQGGPTNLLWCKKRYR